MAKRYKEYGKRKMKDKGSRPKGGKQKSEKYVGVFAATAQGFGFVTVEEEERDFFIPSDCIHSAMHGDTVEIKVNKKGHGPRKAEADIIRIVERGTEYVVGTFQAAGVSKRTGDISYGFVIPDDKHFTEDIFVSRERSKGASDKDKVVVRITDYGNRNRNHRPEGIISEILGDINDPGVDIKSVIRAYGISESFPREVLDEAGDVAKIDEAMKEGRMDLRDLTIITIDGDDSKDFDDAVSLYEKDGAWELGVHIADVSEYVKEGSELDREAYRRGTSVYLPDRVIPMLPEVLSNDICSLNPHEDRLTLSCLMTLDDKGRVKRSEIAETVIKSRHRMTYNKVQKILEGDEGLRKEYEDIVPMLEQMDALAKKIRKRRNKKGAIDFDLPEAGIVLDDAGKTKDVVLRERNDATRLIEDFMLTANTAVAETYSAMHLPFIFRTHDEPDPDGLHDLAMFVLGLGYHLKLKKDDKVDSLEVAKLLKEVEGTREEKLVRTIALRAMKQARYTTEPKGHYGLAMEHYTHFTSPIRRYPDLQIHRIIKEYLRLKLRGERIEHYENILGRVADRSSFLERRADDVERDADKLKMVEYMASRIGWEYDGIISGVTDWGVYVELPNTIEGMIPLRDMTDDYYELDEARYRVVGRASGRSLQLGGRVRVSIVRADKLSREIDMALVSAAD